MSVLLVTDGERLCDLLNHKHLDGNAWLELELLLSRTGRNAALVEFFRELTAVTLAGRIVVAGQSLSEQHEIDTPIFNKLFLEHLQYVLAIPNREMDEVFRFSRRAVSAALETPSRGLLRQVRGWAELRHPRCYMCNVAMDFENSGKHTFITLDHVWPRAYGGNSTLDNMMPACLSCNTKKKRHFATWAMPAIQSLLLGLKPAEQRLLEIDGSFKFALHYRAAHRFAVKNRCSRKDAYLSIGPWADVRMRDDDDVADFFNLENCDPLYC
jgi:hypothetical protein